MLNYHISDWYLSLLDFVLPPNCGGCGTPGFRWCRVCSSKTTVLLHGVCTKCGDIMKDEGVCDRCLEAPPNFDVARSWTTYSGPIQNAVKRMKYDFPDRALGYQLALQLKAYVQQLGWEMDLIAQVPLGKDRKKSRGYNQVSLFAKPLAHFLNKKFLPHGLRRCKETVSQVNLNMDERKANVEGAFSITTKTVQGQTVLLLDDVFTTGATIDECAKALKAGGAKRVYCLTLARAVVEHD